jgi:hypothetical protein
MLNCSRGREGEEGGRRGKGGGGGEEGVLVEKEIIQCKRRSYYLQGQGNQGR